jgi:hypothetical protein
VRIAGKPSDPWPARRSNQANVQSIYDCKLGSWEKEYNDTQWCDTTNTTLFDRLDEDHSDDGEQLDQRSPVKKSDINLARGTRIFLPNLVISV